MLHQSMSIQTIAINRGVGCFAGAIAGSLPPQGLNLIGNLLNCLMLKATQGVDLSDRVDLSDLGYRHLRRSGKYRFQTSVQAAG